MKKLLFAFLLLGFTLGWSQNPVPPRSPPRMNLSLSKDRLTVCQLPADAPLPSWVANANGFISITRTTEELSIVCPETLAPRDAKQESGWRAFKVEGPLDFALTGILAALLDPLAKAGISIFAISTFNTDYILVKADKVEAATQALRAAGHVVRVD
jgi:hypothetical protein